MQVRAIIEAAIECQKGRVKVIPEIMIPLTLDKKEMSDSWRCHAARCG